MNFWALRNLALSSLNILMGLRCSNFIISSSDSVIIFRNFLALFLEKMIFYLRSIGIAFVIIPDTILWSDLGKPSSIVNSLNVIPLDMK